jgi:hypothetical protein
MCAFMESSNLTETMGSTLSQTGPVCFLTDAGQMNGHFFTIHQLFCYFIPEWGAIKFPVMRMQTGPLYWHRMIDERLEYLVE